MIMKKFVKSLLMGALVLSLSVSAMAKDKIFVGTNAEFPPFEYLEKGEVTGFDIELVNEIGKVMDADVKVLDMSFDGLLPALQMKKVDLVIAGMTATEERKKTVSFTQPYYTASQVIIVKEGNNSIKSFDDLKGKKVAVMLGFTGDTIVSEIEGVNVERFNAAYAGIMALQADKVEAVVLDSEPAKNYVKQNPGLVLAEADAEQEEYAIALRKNDKALLEKVEKALAELKANGTYDALIKKYFN
jgi:ABC-type amino acid transport substrate-binding protein